MFKLFIIKVKGMRNNYCTWISNPGHDGSNIKEYDGIGRVHFINLADAPFQVFVLWIKDLLYCQVMSFKRYLISNDSNRDLSFNTELVRQISHPLGQSPHLNHTKTGMECRKSIWFPNMNTTDIIT